jgi:hypothetical protein
MENCTTKEGCGECDVQKMNEISSSFFDQIAFEATVKHCTWLPPIAVMAHHIPKGKTRDGTTIIYLQRNENGRDERRRPKQLDTPPHSLCAINFVTSNFCIINDMENDGG